MAGKYPGTKIAKLTNQQDRFAHAYVESLNLTKAATAAGYTKRNPAAAGAQVLRNTRVLARIEELQAERIARLTVDADWVMKRLIEELNADVADIYDENGVLKDAKDWPDVWRRGLVTHIQTTELYGGTENGKPKVIGRMKDVTLADRVKRIELLGRHINVQAFKERVSIGVDAPLRALFDQIKGQAIRPADEMRTIEHMPDARTHEDDAS